MHHKIYYGISIYTCTLFIINLIHYTFIINKIITVLGYVNYHKSFACNLYYTLVKYALLLVMLTI